jgi:lipoprotein-releasing system ATP-binding protein
MNSPSPAIEVHGLHKSYRLGRTHLHVLRGVSFTVEPKEFIAVVGASGSGKSTLLHLIGLLDRIDKGIIKLEGVDIASLPQRKRNRTRCRDVGFVFQFYHLLPELSVLENTLLPAKVDESLLGWLSHRSARRRAAIEMLERVGLGERMKHRPKELSGGERQRADEPPEVPPGRRADRQPRQPDGKTDTTGAENRQPGHRPDRRDGHSRRRHRRRRRQGPAPSGWETDGKMKGRKKK